LTLFILLEAPHIVAGSTYFYMTIQVATLVSSPPVILQNVTANSVIYTNNTSAKVTVSNDTNNLDVLEVLNQTSDDWQLQLIKYDDTNIGRLTNCTIWFHDESTTSVQIKIIDGEYNQTVGEYYDLLGNGVDCITITASVNATGTSYIYTYLQILKPNTSTYALYIITFEITD
jgi:hypothetical protein